MQPARSSSTQATPPGAQPRQAVALAGPHTPAAASPASELQQRLQETLYAEPVADRWSLRRSAALVLGASAAAWGGVIWLGLTLI